MDQQAQTMNHSVVIAGAGPTGLMLAGELALAGIDVALVERRTSQKLEDSRAGGLLPRTMEVLDQRGAVDRFLSQGKPHHVAAFAGTSLDSSDLPTRYNYWLALFQNKIEPLLIDWVTELGVPIHRGREVISFVQDDSSVTVDLDDGRSFPSRLSRRMRRRPQPGPQDSLYRLPRMGADHLLPCASKGSVAELRVHFLADAG